MKTKSWSGTGRRLFVAFTAFIGLYVVASALALLAISQIHSGLRRTRAQVEGMRVALDLASAVRDQYAHLAHTIIIGNNTHVGFYNEARARVVELSRDMRRHAEQPDEQRWVNEIDQATGQLDRIFKERILPNVLSGHHMVVHEEHHHVLQVVARIQKNTDLLAQRFEESIAELQRFVTVVEKRSFIFGLIFLLVAPLVAAWVGIAIGRSVTRSVAQLQQGAERLAAGDLSTRIDIDSPDEFGVLARQFNAMTASLKEHQKQLIQSEKLAGIGRLAAGVAHEINNPLGVILGYARVMKKKADAPLTEDLSIIEEETLRCKEIVQGLLDLSRPIRINAQPVDMREVCDDVAEKLAKSGKSNQVQVTVSGQGTVTGDALQLRQAVFNLMKNGIEAVEAEGGVEVEIAEISKGIKVIVTDSGKGIDPAVAEQLFDPFVTTKPKGTGLGLAISQAIAHAHGGEITFDRTLPVGARFTLALPREARGDFR